MSHSEFSGEVISSKNELYLSSLSNDLVGIFHEIKRITSTSEDGSGPDALKASSTAISLLKDRVADPKLIPSLPSDFQPLFSNLVQDINNAETHLNKIAELVTKYAQDTPENADSITAVEGPRSDRMLPRKVRRLARSHYSGISRAEYHMRARSHHHNNMSNHHNNGFAQRSVRHQQGYRRAQEARENGMHPRRLQDEGNVCIAVDQDAQDARKADQCFRLAACARHYNIYDLFVFLFGDDIDFETGTVDSKEKIKAEDEVNLIGKVSGIQP